MAEYYAKNRATSTLELEQSLEECSIDNANQRLETNDQPNVVTVPNVFPDASNLSQVNINQLHCHPPWPINMYLIFL